MRLRGLGAVLVLVVCAAALAAPAALAGAKPTAAQSGELLEQGMAAITALHLIEQRGCKYPNLTCITAATRDESKTYATAAAHMRKVATTLSAGKCKTALVRRATAYAKHAALVTRSAAAWRSRNIPLATKLYYTEFDPDGVIDSAYLQHCQ